MPVIEHEQAERLREALRTYAAAYPCPGIRVSMYDEDGTSGCAGPLHSTDDCPTCAAVADAR